jgi:hypothetical protein
VLGEALSPATNTLRTFSWNRFTAASAKRCGGGGWGGTTFEELNTRTMRQYKASRRDLFEKLEAPRSNRCR